MITNSRAMESACLVGLVLRHLTAMLEVVGSNLTLAKQRIKFLGLLRVRHRQGKSSGRYINS